MKDFPDDDVYWWRPLDSSEQDTRGKILFAAYQEMHCQGFQSASISNILARADVTKGALYHYFPNKTELGYAVIEEVIAKRIHVRFIKPLLGFENPIEGIIELIQASADAFSMTDIELGCPLTVLAQEMAPIDEGFRIRLIKIYHQWHRSIADSFRQALDKGQLHADFDPDIVAVTIVATIEGAIHSAKVAQDLNILYRCGTGLIQYLNLTRKN